MIETEGRSQCKLMDAGQIGREKHDRTSIKCWCDFSFLEDLEMADGKKPKRFQGDVWFQKQVTERTKQSLIRLEEEFAKEHKLNTDAELLEYVCEFAKELGRTPNAGEIIGGRYISSRFDGWSNVVASAKLPQPRKMPSFSLPGASV